MKKQGILMSIVALMIFVLYSAIAFVSAGAVKDASFWISFAFTVFAFVVASISLVLIGRKKGIVHNWFLNYPIICYSVVYVVVQTVASIILITLRQKLAEPVAFLIQFAMLAVYVVLILVAFIAKISVEDVSKNIKAKSYYIDLLGVEAEMLCERCDDKQAVAVFKDFAEAVSFSDPMSSQALANLEREISAKVEEAKQLLAKNEVEKAVAICKEAKLLLIERNKKTKILK